MINERGYQTEMVNIAVRKMRKNSKPFILQAATGAGKSIVIGSICHQLDEPVLVLQPSKELLEQNMAKLKAYGITDVSAYSASVGEKKISKYTMATIGSIKNKVKEFKHFRYMIIDECHLMTGEKSMMRKFIDAINPDSVCGLTATPYRIENSYHRTPKGGVYTVSAIRMLNRIAPFFFKSIDYTIETGELIGQGYLSPIQYVIDEAKGIESSALKINSTGSDYTAESLEEYAHETTPRMIKAVQYAAKKHKKILVFACSVEQAHDIAEAVGGRAIDGTTKKKDRGDIVDAFRDGDLHIVVNCMVLLTGFDAPQIDAIVYGRPTVSVALYYQALGRGVRLDPNDKDKVLTFYDMVGVYEKIGRVEDLHVRKEDGGFRDELHGTNGRIDQVPLRTFAIQSKAKKDEARKAGIVI